MKHRLNIIFALAAMLIFAAFSVQAQSEKKMVIALKTDNFELTKTDISALLVGEAETIETDSGKVIDILRTADGVEIYIDGELLEIDFDNEDLDEDIDFEELHKMHIDGEEHKIIVIRKEIDTED